MITEVQKKKLADAVRKQLKLNNFSMRRQGKPGQFSYTISTPDGDNYWWYFYDEEFPRYYCDCTYGSDKWRDKWTYMNLQTVRSHINHCISTLCLDE